MAARGSAWSTFLTPCPCASPADCIPLRCSRPFRFHCDLSVERVRSRPTCGPGHVLGPWHPWLTSSPANCASMDSAKGFPLAFALALAFVLAWTLRNSSLRAHQRLLRKELGPGKDSQTAPGHLTPPALASRTLHPRRHSQPCLQTAKEPIVCQAARFARQARKARGRRWLLLAAIHRVECAISFETHRHQVVKEAGELANGLQELALLHLIKRPSI